MPKSTQTFGTAHPIVMLQMSGISFPADLATDSVLDFSRPLFWGADELPGT